jgi:hypothetical protein
MIGPMGATKFGVASGHGGGQRTVRLSLGRERSVTYFGRIQRIDTRFGTEGSEVQILSPRPISKKTCRIQAARSLGSSLGVEGRNRVLGASNPAFIQNRSRFLASVRRDWSIPPTFASKVLPSTLPDCAVGH